MQIEVWDIHGEIFHFGRRGLGQEESGFTLPSDTLFAALTARMAETRGSAATRAWVEALNADPPALVLSSAFPRAGEIRFFPTPSSMPAIPEAEGTRAKELKKIQFVSESIFRALLEGGSLAKLAADKKLNDGQAVTTQKEWERLPKAVQASGLLWKVEKRARVTIGRGPQDSQIYHTGCTYFSGGCGLWFGVRWQRPDPELKAELAFLLADLSHAGLGGERSSGFGACQIQPGENLELPDPEQGLWVSLGRYLPRADEMNALRHPGAAYKVETVGGWTESPALKSVRRRSVRMLAEGAVLGPVGRSVPGRLEDVQPDYDGQRLLEHPVWRCGLALAVGMQERSA